MEYPLIEDYLKEHIVKTCVFLSCETQEFQKLLNKRGQNDVWYSFWDISNDSMEFELLLIRLSHRVGVVIDLNCSEIVRFLREISKKTFFHHERNWLMFSPDLNQAVNVLQTQNINVDAEISIAIPNNDNDEKYKIFVVCSLNTNYCIHIFQAYIKYMMHTILVLGEVAN